MRLSEEIRKQLLDNLISDFSRIASTEYQKRVWIRGEGPEVDDFDETVNSLFNDYDFILDNYRDFGITIRQYRLLKNFYSKFKVFSDNNFWPEDFIDSPGWCEITERAQDVLKAFNYDKILK